MMDYTNNINNITSSYNVVVTGATGFVGRHVVSKLIENGHKVIALVRDTEKAKKIANLKNAILFPFDISNLSLQLNLPKNSILIHCAWDDVRDTLSLKHLEEHYLANYCFIKKSVALGIKKIVITGSCYEYGLQYGPVFSSTPTKPNTPYALAKDTLHKSLRMLQSEFNFHLVWARLFYIYGEGQDPKSVISLFDAALDRNDKVFNMSLGEQLLDYMPIEQVAEQIVGLLNESDGVFNVCSGKPISLRRLLENRMRERGRQMELNLGFYKYRKQDSLAIWGEDSYGKRTERGE